MYLLRSCFTNLKQFEIFRNDWNGPGCREHQWCNTIVISTLIISIPKVSISTETRELFVHADHLFYLGIKYIGSLTINYFIPQGNRFEFGAFFGVLGHIGMLQATQMTQEVTIKDLESEKIKPAERLSQLEEERAFLQSKTQSLDEEQKQQIFWNWEGRVLRNPSRNFMKGKEEKSSFILFQIWFRSVYLLSYNSLFLNYSHFSFLFLEKRLKLDYPILGICSKYFW